MFKWKKRQTETDKVAQFAQEASLPVPLAGILFGRGITTAAMARVFLEPRISDLHDPLIMDDMEKGAERLCLARKRGERILLFGDYDVDGISSAAAMGKILESLSLRYAFCHPDRLSEGYGFNKRGVQLAIKTGSKLIITLDCGTESIEAVTEARARGIDVIVIDHHLQKGELAPSIATINPRKRSCPYPFEGLVTAGIVLKFARALVEKTRLKIPWDELLQLAALATVADVAQLREENRIITILGLEAINRSPLPGLSALIRASGIQGRRIAAGQLAFQLGPRINAAGRLGTPELATQLLLEANPARCHSIAQDLNRLNSRRQTVEKVITKEAIGQVEKSGGGPKSQFLIAAGNGWHRGVVGIVAARILERNYRPSAVIALENGMGYGSARSIPEFNMFEALCECRDLFTTFGGHRHAAGFSLAADKIEPFRERINRIADETLSEDDLLPKLTVDETVRLKDLSFELLEMMAKIEPFGLGNPRPVFASTGVRLLQKPRLIGRNRDHIKLMLGPAESGGRAVECVGWGMANRLSEMSGELIDVAYAPQINEWRNTRRIQLVLKDIKPAHGNA